MTRTRSNRPWRKLLQLAAIRRAQLLVINVLQTSGDPIWVSASKIQDFVAAPKGIDPNWLDIAFLELEKFGIVFPYGYVKVSRCRYEQRWFLVDKVTAQYWLRTNKYESAEETEAYITECENEYELRRRSRTQTKNARRIAADERSMNNPPSTTKSTGENHG